MYVCLWGEKIPLGCTKFDDAKQTETISFKLSKITFPGLQSATLVVKVSHDKEVTTSNIDIEICPGL